MSHVDFMVEKISGDVLTLEWAENCLIGDIKTVDQIAAATFYCEEQVADFNNEIQRVFSRGGRENTREISELKIGLTEAHRVLNALKFHRRSLRKTAEHEAAILKQRKREIYTKAIKDYFISRLGAEAYQDALRAVDDAYRESPFYKPLEEYFKEYGGKQ
jgi:hypothetical protein